MKILYDPECEALARYFLEDVKNVEENDVQELAGTIQHAIELWIFSFEHPDLKVVPEPEDYSGQGDED